MLVSRKLYRDSSDLNIGNQTGKEIKQKGNKPTTLCIINTSLSVFIRLQTKCFGSIWLIQP